MKTKLYYLAIAGALSLIGFRSQAQTLYELKKGSNVNLRTTPSTKGRSLGLVRGGEIVTLIDSTYVGWYRVQYGEHKGYMSSRLLSRVKEEVVDYTGWEEHALSTGDAPDCENINVEYDAEAKNELLIHTGSSSDVVVKLMNINNVCTRIAYIKAGESYSMKNIPLGMYYLKLAYGSDFRKYKLDGKCEVKFMRDALYELGSDRLEFLKEQLPDRVVNGETYRHSQFSTFEIRLETAKLSSEEQKLRTRGISEAEFNR